MGLDSATTQVPSGLLLGCSWTESLLWIEPESACIDTNITLEYSVSGQNQADHPKLVDHGGFTYLTRDYPFVDMNATQTRPELLARAWKGAVLNNLNLMIFFNETRNTTSLGKLTPCSPLG